MLTLLEVTANGIVMRKASVPKNTKGLFEKSLKKVSHHERMLKDNVGEEVTGHIHKMKKDQSSFCS